MQRSQTLQTLQLYCHILNHPRLLFRPRPLYASKLCYSPRFFAFSRSSATFTIARTMADAEGQPQPEMTKKEEVQQEGEKQAEETKQLPKLSAAEFREFNRMAVMMEAYHERFRAKWNLIYKACETGKRPAGMSIKQFLSTVETFCEHLTMHHQIEEHYIFPHLAVKMPSFRPEIHLLGQHKLIHEGIEKMEEYLAACRSGEKDFRLSELKSIMDTWGAVLWTHLAEEVEQLGAENMRKYWSLGEMKKLTRRFG